jgi:hypothetical protein
VADVGVDSVARSLALTLNVVGHEHRRHDEDDTDDD